MHAHQQLEIGAWIATQATTIIDAVDRHDGLLSDTYWLASKARNSRWNTALKTFEKDLNGINRVFNPWPALEVIIEEIVVSEFLTRIWAAVAVSVDLKFQQREFSPLAHSIFISHMESRSRVMRMLLRSRAENEPVFDRINQLRRAVEKWTDLFLALFPNREIARRFSFDSKRHDDFTTERADYDSIQAEQRANLLLNSVEKVFSSQCGKWSANPELNGRIVDGIIATISCETLDVEKMPRLVQIVWKEKSRSVAEALVSRLSQLDA